MAVVIRPYPSFALDAIISLDAINYTSGPIWIDRSINPGDNAILTDVTTTTTPQNFQVLAFDGSTSVATVANRNWNFDSEQTIMMAIQRSNNSRRNPYNQAYGGGGTWTHETNNTINYYFGTTGLNQSPFSNLTSGFTVVPDEWAIVATTRSLNTIRWYKNGNFTNSRANPYGALTTGTQDILIGDGYAGNYPGNIGFCFVWDRELSATEIKTYYDRTKLRFGLS